MEALSIRPLAGKIILRKVMPEPGTFVLPTQKWMGECEVGTPLGEFKVGDRVLVNKFAHGFVEVEHEGMNLLIGNPDNILARL